MSPSRILVVEDEAGLRLTLGDRLEAEGYLCEFAVDAPSGAALAREPRFDLILLDLMLPGGSGFDLCRDLRASGVATPVLMLTARSQLIDKVLGLKLGADDYLCKPFEAAELMARIEALLRRASRASASASPAAPGGARAGSGAGPGASAGPRRDSLSFEGFAVDFARGLVLREGAESPLSAQEFKLLSYLVEHPGEVLDRETLLEAVWDYGAEVTSRTVDVHVAWLRQKIGDSALAPRHIRTVRGLGYRFVP